MNIDVLQLAAGCVNMLPEAALLAGAVIAMLLAIGDRQQPRRAAFRASLAALAAACAAMPTQIALFVSSDPRARMQNVFHAEWLFKSVDQPYGFGMLVVDGVAMFFKAAVALAMLTVLYLVHTSDGHEAGTRPVDARRLGLLLVMTLALFVMTGANDLVLLAACMEIVTITGALIAAGGAWSRTGLRASYSRLVYGCVATAVTLFGITLFYGLFGTTNLGELGLLLDAPNTQNALRNPFIIAGVLVLAGFASKVVAVPFHFGTPEAVSDVPASVATALSVPVMLASTAALIRFIVVAYPVAMQGFDWRPVLAGLAVLTMTLANVSALAERNVRRIVMFAMIAQSGCMLAGLAVSSEAGVGATLTIAAAFTLSALGAFTVVAMLGLRAGSDLLEEWRGIGRSAPLLAWLFLVFLAALAGLPLTVGFVGRWMLLAALADAGAGYIWLGGAVALNMLLAAYGAMRAARVLFAAESREAVAPEFPAYAAGARLVLPIVLALATIALGVPGLNMSLVDLVREALRGMQPYLASGS